MSNAATQFLAQGTPATRPHATMLSEGGGCLPVRGRCPVDAQLVSVLPGQVEKLPPGELLDLLDGGHDERLLGLLGRTTVGVLKDPQRLRAKRQPDRSRDAGSTPSRPSAPTRPPRRREPPRLSACAACLRALNESWPLATRPTPRDQVPRR